MESLRTYLSVTGESQRDFAKRVRVSPSHLSEIISLRKQPSLALAFEISRATNQRVPVECWDTSGQSEQAVEVTPAENSAPTIEHPHVPTS